MHIRTADCACYKTFAIFCDWYIW